MKYHVSMTHTRGSLYRYPEIWSNYVKAHSGDFSLKSIYVFAKLKKVFLCLYCLNTLLALSNRDIEGLLTVLLGFAASFLTF